MREKLIELLREVQYQGNAIHGYHDKYIQNGELADHLIANGVVVSKMETTTKWIPVTERLPETIPCGAGTAYSEAVNVLTDGRKVLTAIWNGTHWICDAEFWDAEFEEITHWTPVLLPLPEPPKGE